MTVNYTFFKSLHSMLTTDNWSGLSDQFEIIRQKIDKEPKKIDKFKYKSLDKIERAQDNINEKIGKLKTEQQKIVKFIVDKSYKLGITPFENTELAEFMLKNALLLDQPGLAADSVSAIKAMLTNNFKKLYTPEISSTAIKNYFEDNDDVLFFKRIISIIDLEVTPEFKDFISKQDNLSKKRKKVLKYLEREEGRFIEREHEAFNPVLLKQIFDIMSFIGQFYPSGEVKVISYTITLAMLFEDIKAVEKFLGGVNFSSPQTIEAGIQIQNNENYCPSKLSTEERKLWHSVNNEFGKDGIKLFAKAIDIQKAKIDVTKIAKDNNGNLQEIFNEIQEKYAKEKKFDKEDQYPELSELCHQYNFSKEEFNYIVENILPTQKTEDNLPNIEFDVKVDEKVFHFKKLQPGDIKGLFLGRMTDCCQSIFGDSHRCALDGYTKKEAGFYIITEKGKDKIFAQSYAWNGSNGELVLDSFEYLPEGEKLFLPVMQKLFNNSYNITIYVGVGGKTPDINTESFLDITPKDKTIFQYGDSKETYKITEAIKPQKIEKKIEIEKKVVKSRISFENFDEFLSAHSKFKKILMEKDADKHNKHDLKKASDFILYIIKKSPGLVKMIHSMLECKGSLHFLLKNNFKLALEIKTKIMISLQELKVGVDDQIKVLNFLCKIDPALAAKVNSEKLAELVQICLTMNGLPDIFTTNYSLAPEVKIVFINKGLIDVDITTNKADHALEKLSKLDAAIAEKMNFNQLVELLELCKTARHLPYIFSSSCTLDPEVKIVFMTKLLADTKIGIENAANVLEKLSMLDPTIEGKINFNKLVEFCKITEFFLPSIFTSHCPLTSAVKIALINKVLEDTDIKTSYSSYRILSTLSNLDTAIAEQVDLNHLVEYCKTNGYLPSIFISPSQLTHAERIALISEVLAATYRDTDKTELSMDDNQGYGEKVVDLLADGNNFKEGGEDN